MFYHVLETLSPDSIFRSRYRDVIFIVGAATIFSYRLDILTQVIKLIIQLKYCLYIYLSFMRAYENFLSDQKLFKD